MHFFNKAILVSLVNIVLLTLSPAQAESVTKTIYPPLDKFQWTYDTDPYGSEAIINEKLIRHAAIWIKFKRAPRINATRNTWVELIHKIPAASLTGVDKIRVTYLCEKPLIVRLSKRNQGSNFDKGGNNIPPQYQIELPATKQWLTQEISLQDFSLPLSSNLTTNEKKEDAAKLNPEKIDAIYLIPKMTDKEGGEAIIQIRALELLTVQ